MVSHKQMHVLFTGHTTKSMINKLTEKAPSVIEVQTCPSNCKETGETLGAKGDRKTLHKHISFCLAIFEWSHCF